MNGYNFALLRLILCLNMLPESERVCPGICSLKIEANTERILERQDEILTRVNELKCPLTIIPPNIKGLFIRGFYIKLRYIIIVFVVILAWAVAASLSSMKYKEEAFAYYSMYRAVKEQHQYLMERTSTKVKRNTE